MKKLLHILLAMCCFQCFGFAQTGQNMGAGTAGIGSTAVGETEFNEVVMGLQLEIEECQRFADKARIKIQKAREDLLKGIHDNAFSEEEIAERKRKISTAERKLKVLETRLHNARQYSTGN